MALFSDHIRPVPEQNELDELLLKVSNPSLSSGPDGQLLLPAVVPPSELQARSPRDQFGGRAEVQRINKN